MDNLAKKTTAIHEAGRAVAFARSFGDDHWRIHHALTIEPDGGNLGTHLAEELYSPPASASDENFAEYARDVENEAIHACGGYAALIAAGYTESEATEGCAQDFAPAMVASQLPLNNVKAKAVELLERPENIDAVSLLASELLDRKSLDETEVAIIISIADGSATAAELAQYRYFTFGELSYEDPAVKQLVDVLVGIAAREVAKDSEPNI